MTYSVRDNFEILVTVHLTIYSLIMIICICTVNKWHKDCIPKTPKLLLFLLPEQKGVPSAVGFPHCAGSGKELSLSPKPYPHKRAEAGARTRDLPVTDGRLYRCTKPALQFTIRIQGPVLH